uniref:Uncharacterized protein n=1 Tax=Romanomermis culicivorax TaxID=13658 RepID=A0A915IGK8_ROMCU
MIKENQRKQNECQISVMVLGQFVPKYGGKSVKYIEKQYRENKRITALENDKQQGNFSKCAAPKILTVFNLIESQILI